MIHYTQLYSLPPAPILDHPREESHQTGTPGPSLSPLLLTSSGHHARPVQTCSLEGISEARTVSKRAVRILLNAFLFSILNMKTNQLIIKCLSTFIFVLSALY